MCLLLLDSLAESRGELSTLHQDETLGVLSADSSDGAFPPLQIAEFGPDVLVVSVFALPVLEDEVSVEVVDDPAGFELLDDLLELVEVEGNAPLDGRLGGAVCLRVLDDSPEAWATVADEPVDELVEVLVADDSAYLLGDALHVLKDLLELGDELALGWLEGHVFLSEAHSGLDTVLFRVLGHLREDEVGTLLVDSDLGLDDHVVDESDEGAKAVVVSLGELQDSILEGVLLLLKHHRLVLGGLTHLGVLQVFLLLQRPGVAHRCNQHRQLRVDDLLDFLVVVGLDRLPGGLLVGNKVDKLLELSSLWNAEGLERLHLVEGLVDVHEAL
jgi:hypothetical protein